MSEYPLILGIDTALGISSISLCKGENEIASSIDEERGKQAISLVSNIEKTLKYADISYAELTGFAVSIGPGGFTGIRVGLATARALAHATQKPIIGFSSLAILQYVFRLENPNHSSTPLAILPAGRDKYFIQTETAPKMILKNELSSVVDKANEIVTNIDGLKAECKIYNHAIQKNAYILCQMAKENGFENIAQPPSPLYVRPVDAKVQKKFFAKG